MNCRSDGSTFAYDQVLVGREAEVAAVHARDLAQARDFGLPAVSVTRPDSMRNVRSSGRRNPRSSRSGRPTT